MSEPKRHWFQFHLSTAGLMMITAGWLIWTAICCLHYFRGIPPANNWEVLNVAVATAFVNLSPFFAIGLAVWLLLGSCEYVFRRRAKVPEREEDRKP